MRWQVIFSFPARHLHLHIVKTIVSLFTVTIFSNFSKIDQNPYSTCQEESTRRISD